MNPDTMNYLVNSLDDAMIDRFISIEVTAEIEDYVEYSLKNKPNDNVLAYLQACPDMLLVTKKAADSTALSKYPTPRGWTKVQELMNHCKLEDKLMRELIAGIIGNQAAASFYGYLRNRDIKIPSTSVLLGNYSLARENILNLINKKHIEIINYVIKKLVLSFQPESQQLSCLEQFLEDLPQELQVLFYKYLSVKRPETVEALTEHSKIFDDISEKIVDIISMDFKGESL
jgi:hypothetical protein